MIVKSQARVLLFILSLIAVTFLLYFKNLFGFWRCDDTQILLQALKHSWWEYFFVPDVWQTLSAVNLTPWVTLSFDLDFLLFGVNPFGFYFHQLITLAAVAVATFFLLSLWLEKHWAFLGALLFLVGAPVETVTHRLMTRHYLEGLFFSILAVYFFISYRTTLQYRFILGSVLFYGLAISAKEIYVPLVILLFFIQRKEIYYQFKRNLPATLPFVLVVVIYILWRNYMIPAMIGGYAGGSDYFSPVFWHVVLLSFGKIPLFLSGSYWALFIGTYLTALFSYFFVRKDKLLITILSLVLVLLPLVPLVEYPGIGGANRYLLHIWYLFCFSFTYFLSAIRRSVYVTGFAWFLMFAVVFSHAQNVANVLDRISKESDVQMRFAWEHDHRFSFVPTELITGSFWLLTGINDIKIFQNHLATSPTAIVDDMFLRLGESPFEYDDSCQCMRDVGEQVGQRIDRLKKMIRENAPLFLDMKNDDGFIQWTFGPHRGGQYRVLSERFGSFIAPDIGSLRSNIRDSFSFYLLYISPNDWKTYSPLITLAAEGKSVHWQRLEKESTP